MSGITTHVLDTARGIPAHGVPITLELLGDGQSPKLMAKGTTNEDGRVSDFLPADFSLQAGIYRMTFDTTVYFEKNGTEGFYPYVKVVFEIRDPAKCYHVPLLLSPFGYSTYRGS
jgi:5-hydroxyisourate hydrolase